MTAVDHAELKRLAEGATPGPWKACGTIYEHMNCEIRGGVKGEGQAIAQVWDGPNAFKDGQWIAAANPAVVLALLSEIEGLKAERAKRLEGDAVEPIERAIKALKRDITSIQDAKKRGGSGASLTDCINRLPEIVRWLESGVFNVEAAFEQYEDAADLRTQAPDSWRPDREAVARVVDFQAWDFYDRHIGNPIMLAECKHEVGPSLAKADAILALLPQAAESGK